MWVDLAYVDEHEVGWSCISCEAGRDLDPKRADSTDSVGGRGIVNIRSRLSEDQFIEKMVD